MQHERTGITYKLVGEYYLIAVGEPKTEIGIWDQCHADVLRQHRKETYTAMVISGTLYDRLIEIDRHAEDMFDRLIEQYAKQEGVIEKLKTENQMEWVRRINGIRERVTEIVNRDLI